MNTIESGFCSPIGSIIDWAKTGPLLILEKPGDAIQVEQGRVDVFAVPASGAHNGARASWIFLGRLDQNSVLCGGRKNAPRRIAVRRDHASLLRRVSLRHLGHDPRPFLATMNGLDALRPPELPPREFTALVNGSVTLAKRMTARPIEDELWLRAIPELRLFGPGTAGVDHGEWVGLTPDNWVEVEQSVRVDLRSTGELASQGQLAEAFCDHVTHLLRHSQITASMHVETMHTRMKIAVERDATSQRLLATANHRLCSGDSGEPGFFEGLGQHAAAMIRVARAAGHRVVPDSRLLPALQQAGSFAEVSRIGWLRTRPLTLEDRWWRTPCEGFVTTYGSQRIVCSVIWDYGAPWIHLAGQEEARPVMQSELDLIHRDAFAVEVPAPQQVKSVKQLIRTGLAGSKRDLVDLVVVSILVIMLNMATPLISGQVLGEFLLRAHSELTVQVGLILLALLTLSCLLVWMQNLIALRVRGRMVQNIGTALWGKLLRLPLPFFEKRSAGALGTVMLGIRGVDEALSSSLIIVVVAGAVTLANLIVMLVMAPVLGWAFTVLLIVVGFTVMRLCMRQVDHARAHYRAQQRSNSMALSLISTVAKIRVAGAQSRALSRWASLQREAYQFTLMERRAQNRMMIFASALTPVALAILFLIAAPLSASIGITSVLTAIVAAQLVVTNAVVAISSIQSLAPLFPVLSEIQPILTEIAESGDGRAQPGELSGSIMLHEVSFKYGNDGPLVLDRVSLSIRRGEFVAIVGPSGSGKSTILRMLLGFERPLSGSILYDGQDLVELDAAAVRRQCGIVLQNNATLPGSIRDNICGGGQYSDAEVWDAAEMAGMADEIRAMPMKLATHVPDGGAGLSGGQRQRLMIARALISKPRIVMFDEATSALDNPTQSKVTSSTRMLNATRIVVAHRLSTVRDADRIIVLDRGRIVEFGTFDELASKGGLFAAMIRRQS